MKLFHSLPEKRVRPKNYSPGLLMSNSKSYKKNQKSITANIKNYLKICLFKKFPFISLLSEIIETLETIEFKTPIIEFKCFNNILAHYNEIIEFNN